MFHTQHQESGLEEWRELNLIIERTVALPAFDNFSLEMILALARACRRTRLGICPDQLSAGQIARIVADPNYVPRFAEGRFGLEPIE